MTGLTTYTGKAAHHPDATRGQFLCRVCLFFMLYIIFCQE